MGEKTREFNKTCAEHINKIACGIKSENSEVKNLVYYRLRFSCDDDSKQLSYLLYLSKTGYGEVCTQPEDFIAYYWITFEIGNEQYKIALFYKDFDHRSGNIHVLPGLLQVFRKHEEIDETEDFRIKKGCTSKITNIFGFEKPKYNDHSGGKPFCEGKWRPCLGYTKLTRDNFTILRSGDCAYCFGKDFGKELSRKSSESKAFDNYDFYSKYCSRSKEASLIHTAALKGEIYKGIQYGEKHNEASPRLRLVAGGVSTYNLLKWQNLKEEQVIESVKATHIRPLYNIVFVEEAEVEVEAEVEAEVEVEGFFYVLGPNQEYEAYELNELKTGPNVVVEDDNSYFWKIKYLKRAE